MGLTYNEAKVFFVLSQLEEASVNVLAKSTRINRQHLYEPLVKLEKKGLVKKVISNPSKYSALPVKNAVNMLIEMRNKKTYELQIKAIKMIKSLEEKQTTQQDTQETKTVLLRGREAFRESARKMLDNIQISFDGIGNIELLRRGFYYDKIAFHKALKRGVLFRQIINSPINEPTILGDEDLREKPQWQIRIATKLIPFQLMIMDRKTVFISATLDTKMDYLFYQSNSASILFITQTYFDMIWSNSSDIKTSKFNPSSKQDNVRHLQYT